MKKFVELKYHKNSKQEIVFENLDVVEGNDNVVLKLEDGDITPLIQILYIQGKKYDNNFYIPYIPIEPMQSLIEHKDIFNILLHYNANTIFTFDSFLKLECKSIKNILPKWDIPEDRAILFFNKEDCKKYKEIVDNSVAYFTYPNLESEEDCLNRDYFSIKDYKNISIILPELHAEDKNCSYHINNINKVCKELKEKYGIESIELFVSHCFVDIVNNKNIFYIDKITTTNSTGILEVQNNERLTVIDCVEFFKD